MARWSREWFDELRLRFGVPAGAIFVALLALRGAACSSSNIHDQASTKAQLCYSCHAAAYNNVKSPVHPGVFPTTCQDCHSTTAWIPTTANAGGHPESLFPITTGPHANAAISCGDCHNASLGGADGGANTDCLHCHTGDHITPNVDSVPAHQILPQCPNGTDPMAGTCYTASTTANISPHYCLGCHPDGLASTKQFHPESTFPIATGWHASQGIVCTDCHNPANGSSTGGGNCDCTKCHLGAHNRPAIDSDPSHTALGTQYTNIPVGTPLKTADAGGALTTATNFCLNCHPNGNASAAGHPESAFPIATGSHHNPAIGCTDCHITSNGPSAAGQNTDCIHCHIGAHATPSIDSDPKHTALGIGPNPQYTPTTTTGYNPNSVCRACHPTG